MNLSGFAEFCETPGVGASGKGTSYENGIRYLCNFLNIDTRNITIYDLERIKHNESLIRNSNSQFYSNFLDFLVKKHGTSYLHGGFIRAALPYFYKFCWSREGE